MDSFPSFTRGDRLLLLAPHPDDEALAAGGLLQAAARAGAFVRVIFLTDGDKNPWPQRVIECRWRISGSVARARWGALRRREALESLAVLGHGPDVAEFWSLPDQGLTNLLLAGGTGLIGKLGAAITEWQPTWLVAPAACDRHPDHSAVGVAAALALRERARCGELNPGVLGYIVHGNGRPESPLNYELPLAPDEVEVKRQAILRHRSQTLLSRRRFLAHAQPEEIFLPETTAQDREGGHPLRVSHWEAQGPNIIVESSLTSRVLGKRELHVVVASGTARPRHQCVILPSSARLCQLRLPQEIYETHGSSIFIKLKTINWLFDTAGWMELRPQAGQSDPEACETEVALSPAKR